MNCVILVYNRYMDLYHRQYYLNPLSFTKSYGLAKCTTALVLKEHNGLNLLVCLTRIIIILHVQGI